MMRFANIVVVLLISVAIGAQAFAQGMHARCTVGDADRIFYQIDAYGIHGRADVEVRALSEGGVKKMILHIKEGVWDDNGETSRFSKVSEKFKLTIRGLENMSGDPKARYPGEVQMVINKKQIDYNKKGEVSCKFL